MTVSWCNKDITQTKFYSTILVSKHSKSKHFLQKCFSTVLFLWFLVTNTDRHTHISFFVTKSCWKDTLIAFKCHAIFLQEFHNRSKNKAYCSHSYPGISCPVTANIVLQYLHTHTKKPLELFVWKQYVGKNLLILHMLQNYSKCRVP